MQAQRAGCDDERFVGAFEGGAHGFDGGAVFGAAVGENGEVVVEGEVDDAVGGGGGGFQGVEVVDGSAVGLGAESFQLLYVFVGAGEAGDGVAGLDEFTDDGLADEAGRAGNEDVHGGEWNARLDS